MLDKAEQAAELCTIRGKRRTAYGKSDTDKKT